MSESPGHLPGTLVALTLGLGTASAGAGEGPRPPSGPMWVYVGTYTGPESKGIYRLKFDAESGGLSAPEVAAETPNPSFLAIAPDGRHLYAVNEIDDFEGAATGSVSAFTLDPSDGSLQFLGAEPSGGTSPCHLGIDRGNKHVLVANYGGGSVSVLPIGEGGRLGAPTRTVQHEGKGHDPGRQDGPHAHSIKLDPAGRHALAADLGLDRLFAYRYGPDAGRLAPADPPAAEIEPGAGPRHFAFGAGGDRVYLINELDNTIIVYKYDSEAGTFEQVQSVTTLPEGFDGASYTAEVVVHPSGRFVYGSNRGHDSLAIFAVSEADGTLKPLGHEPTGGKTPRNFNIDPTGRFLIAANQGSDNLVVFKVDQQNGALSRVGEPVTVPSPVCVVFLPIPE